MTFISKDVTVQQIEETIFTNGPTLYKLLKEVSYKDNDVEFVVPTDYVTDFASVPRATAWMIPSSGSWNPAAIIHDYLISDVLEKQHAIKSNHVDQIFYNAMKELGVPWYRRTIMYGGVRLGALFNKRRRGGWWKTAHRVLGCLVLSLPLLPAALAVQLTIWVAAAVTWPLPDRAKVNAQKT